MKPTALLTALALAVACTPPPASAGSPSPTAIAAASATPMPTPTPRPTAAPRPDVAGLGPDAVIAGADSVGSYATDGESVAYVRGGQLLVATPAGTTVVYEVAAGRSGIFIRPDGLRGGRLAFVDVGSGQTKDSHVVTLELRRDAKPVILDSVQLVLAGGGPWDDEPRPITNGYQVLWLRYERDAASYMLLRSLGGEPGTELFRSRDPFLFTTNLQGDVLIATRPQPAVGNAKLQVLDKNGRLRTIAERPAARAGAPLALADRFGWTDGLLELGTMAAFEGRVPATAVDLWNVLSGERERIELPCRIAGGTLRHVVGFCTDRYVVRDVITGASSDLPAPERGFLIVSKTGLLRGSADRWAVTTVTMTVERFPDPPPTAAWSTNRSPGAATVSLYLYYGTPALFLGAATRLVDLAGTVVAPGPVMGSGIFGPESCVARVDGSLYNVFGLRADVADDLVAHPDRYRFEVEFGGAWKPLRAIDSGCRTTLP